MARDRQRSKQRRTRPAGASAGAAGRGGRRGRELSGTPTPDPLEHASAEVDEALLAEAGAQPPEVRAGEPDEEEAPRADRAPDVEEATAGAVAASGREAPGRAGRGGVVGFVRASVDELRRVQWPDRRQVGQGTAVTLGFVVIAGGYLGLLDAIWKPLIDAIL
jgi:preprotein translocase SecE subunit